MTITRLIAWHTGSRIHIGGKDSPNTTGATNRYSHPAGSVGTSWPRPLMDAAMSSSITAHSRYQSSSPPSAVIKTHHSAERAVWFMLLPPPPTTGRSGRLSPFGGTAWTASCSPTTRGALSRNRGSPPDSDSTFTSRWLPTSRGTIGSAAAPERLGHGSTPLRTSSRGTSKPSGPQPVCPLPPHRRVAPPTLKCEEPEPHLIGASRVRFCPCLAVKNHGCTN